MPEESQRLNSVVVSASQAAAKAGVSFNDTQIKVNEDIVQALQQLSYVAAGTISLSITFLGYLLSQGETTRAVLASHFLMGIPLIWLLFVSWILLSVAVILGLLYRFFNSWYLYGTAGSDWAETNKKAKEKMLEFIDAGLPIFFEETNDREQGRTGVDESKRNYAMLHGVFKSNTRIYTHLTYLSRRVAIAVFISGMLLLLVFVITVSVKII
jgi:hypothetical protein